MVPVSPAAPRSIQVAPSPTCCPPCRDALRPARPSPLCQTRQQLIQVPLLEIRPWGIIAAGQQRIAGLR
ncbi:hypothetical protein E2C01_037068 [Portunus trituberculatus]|uniref:Uncharacterized protein n=1 Tax=Portunus trituberculatus TaxID=210409 RepID=A0A5B7FAF1_PORTR|nr:hypothetical protein [Portunus trituberculatus]